MGAPSLPSPFREAEWRFVVFYSIRDGLLGRSAQAAGTEGAVVETMQASRHLPCH